MVDRQRPDSILAAGCGADILRAVQTGRSAIREGEQSADFACLAGFSSGVRYARPLTGIQSYRRWPVQADGRDARCVATRVQPVGRPVCRRSHPEIVIGPMRPSWSHQKMNGKSILVVRLYVG